MLMPVLTACSSQPDTGADKPVTDIKVIITLADDGILMDGQPVSTDSNDAVYTANDIIFYLAGQGSEYGEGEAYEEHTQEEADKHTVLYITQPGNYIITGTLSYGQIAVDLGKEAKNDPSAVVTLTLDNADITCTVAPAIVCFAAYECGSKDVDTAVKDVDTSSAGFNITLADGSVNNINGGHVAKIYKPGTTDKQHKYDAAIESLVSLNINGTDGVLNLTSDNEGIETKLHMTINGGKININSADDSLNAGEDYVSVITINDGQLYANANNGQEGDGIDSNGWLVINGGIVSAFSSEKSMDSGLDSDNGIYINGGIVYATGSMYDTVETENAQSVVVFSMMDRVYSNEYLVLKSSAGDSVVALNSPAAHKIIVYSSPLLTADDYTLYKAEQVTGDSLNGIYTEVDSAVGEIQMAHSGDNNGMGMRPQGGIDFGGGRPQGGRMPEGGRPQKGDFQFDGGKMPDFTENMTAPENFGGQMPQGFGGQPPQGENFQMPEGFNGQMPESFNNQFSQDFAGRIPQGGFANNPFESYSPATEQSTVFTFTQGLNFFSNVRKTA